MNDKDKLILVAVAAFLLGDYEAVLRGRRIMRKLKKNHKKVQIENQEMRRTLEDIARGEPKKDAIRDFNERIQFINIMTKENL